MPEADNFNLVCMISMLKLTSHAKRIAIHPNVGQWNNTFSKSVFGFLQLFILIWYAPHGPNVVCSNPAKLNSDC
jgi:hypothetical protein